jgi:hypothetical protein
MKGEYIDLLSQSFGQWSKYFVQVVNILSLVLLQINLHKINAYHTT